MCSLWQPLPSSPLPRPPPPSLPFFPLSSHLSPDHHCCPSAVPLPSLYHILASLNLTPTAAGARMSSRSAGKLVSPSYAEGFSLLSSVSEPSEVSRVCTLYAQVLHTFAPTSPPPTHPPTLPPLEGAPPTAWGPLQSADPSSFFLAGWRVHFTGGCARHDEAARRRASCRSHRGLPGSRHRWAIRT